MPSEVSQLSWGLFNDSLEKIQETEKAWDLKLLVVASIYLAVEFLSQEKQSGMVEEEKSIGGPARSEALKKFQILSAGCKESEMCKEESQVNYEEFMKVNCNWWSIHFGISDSDLTTAAEIILSIYEQ